MIAGLDLSTKRIGYADPSGATHSISTQAGPKEPARRLHGLVWGLERLLRAVDQEPRLVVVEGYGLGSPGRLSLVRLGELGGAVRLRLFELDIPYVEISPSSLKKYATGSGAAKKPAMIAAAAELGAPGLNDDEADAFLLRHLGRDAYGLDGSVELDYRAAVIASIPWPDIKELAHDRPTQTRQRKAPAPPLRL